MRAAVACEKVPVLDRPMLLTAAPNQPAPATPMPPPNVALPVVVFVLAVVAPNVSCPAAERYSVASVPNPMPPALLVCVASWRRPFEESMVVPNMKFPLAGTASRVVLFAPKSSVEY